MFLFLLYTFCNINVKLKPNEPFIADFELPEDSSHLKVTVYRISPDVEIKYLFIKDNVNLDELIKDEDDNKLENLKQSFETEVKVHGTYSIILLNKGDTEAMVNIYSYTEKILGNEDPDVKNLQKMFHELKLNLTHLNNINMRLKSMQDLNISELKRVIKGFYVILAIPFFYVLVGICKVKAVKMMFAPKKGLKP